MKELVDLYAKLLIGTFSFIGPSFTLFISFFYKQLERALEEFENQQAIFNVVTSTKEIKKAIKKIEKAQKRHDPHRQVRHVFGALLLSIFLVCFYYFQHTHFWPFKYEWVRITTISLSILLFLYCLLILWQVFCIIIEAKKAEEDDRRRNENKLRKLKPNP